jgi:hypothetical protein
VVVSTGHWGHLVDWGSPPVSVASGEPETSSPAALGEGPMRHRRTRVRFPPPPRVLRGSREHRWRCPASHVEVVYVARPLDGVAHTNARRLRLGPKLQISGTVVVTDTVDVVNRLPRQRVSAQKSLGDKDVLEDVWATRSRPRMARRPHHHVPGFVPRPAAPPVTVPRADLAPAGSTRRRLGLFLVATPAQVTASTRGAAPMPT